MAITSGMKDMQAVLNLVWDQLLPGPKKAAAARGPEAGPELKTQAGRVEARGRRRAPRPPRASAVSGRTYVFPANDDKVGVGQRSSSALRGRSSSSSARPARTSRVPCGRGRVAPGAGPSLMNGVSQKARGSGAWTSDHTYTAKNAVYETPFIATLVLQFKGDDLPLDADTNVGFGTTKRPQLVGKRVAAAELQRTAVSRKYGNMGA